MAKESHSVDSVNIRNVVPGIVVLRIADKDGRPHSFRLTHDQFETLRRDIQEFRLRR